MKLSNQIKQLDMSKYYNTVHSTVNTRQKDDLDSVSTE